MDQRLLYQGFDKAVEEYKEVYFKPAKATLDDLYGKGLLNNGAYFDEHLERQFYVFLAAPTNLLQERS
ncbi:hypothetical protein [Desulfosarcina ovata]|uniref:Uncharacterized protein n=1 Tax=Desulfosarcina ovata subsp. ovata TaxID=2752305 RepID=A0A5K8AAA9_9BACT|nr:hypothetical protein [Desulfosarcina ovata]BBO89552.1 hypothetical protein DSCOOX_27320 [Desulfosarcina ovata subsp. ovata]